ncbi:unnamed protein product [Cochlearia groenlandica]
MGGEGFVDVMLTYVDEGFMNEVDAVFDRCQNHAILGDNEKDVILSDVVANDSEDISSDYDIDAMTELIDKEYPRFSLGIDLQTDADASDESRFEQEVVRLGEQEDVLETSQPNRLGEQQEEDDEEVPDTLPGLYLESVLEDEFEIPPADPPYRDNGDPVHYENVYDKTFGGQVSPTLNISPLVVGTKNQSMSLLCILILLSHQEFSQELADIQALSTSLYDLHDCTDLWRIACSVRNQN